MTYAQIALNYVLENKSISHKEILRITDTNCPYGVLRDLKPLLKAKGYYLSEEKCKSSKNKPFKRYNLEVINGD